MILSALKELGEPVLPDFAPSPPDPKAVAVARLKKQYVAGDLSLPELEDAIECAMSGEFKHGRRCLVCDLSPQIEERGGGVSVPCPGCRSPRDSRKLRKAMKP